MCVSRYFFKRDNRLKNRFSIYKTWLLPCSGCRSLGLLIRSIYVFQYSFSKTLRRHRHLRRCSHKFRYERIRNRRIYVNSTLLICVCKIVIHFKMRNKLIKKYSKVVLISNYCVQTQIMEMEVGLETRRGSMSRRAGDCLNGRVIL